MKNNIVGWNVTHLLRLRSQILAPRERTRKRTRESGRKGEKEREKLLNFECRNAKQMNGGLFDHNGGKE